MVKLLNFIAINLFFSRLHDTVVMGSKGPFTVIQNKGANIYEINMPDILGDSTAGWKNF